MNRPEKILYLALSPIAVIVCLGIGLASLLFKILAKASNQNGDHR